VICLLLLFAARTLLRGDDFSLDSVSLNDFINNIIIVIIAGLIYKSADGDCSITSSFLLTRVCEPAIIQRSTDDVDLCELSCVGLNWFSSFSSPLTAAHLLIRENIKFASLFRDKFEFFWDMMILLSYECDKTSHEYLVTRNNQSATNKKRVIAIVTFSSATFH
jgi:hypothetical protein